jgi:nucleoside-diphosphate-sugar epimerase
MGPSLSRMAKRAGGERRIFAVARWSNQSVLNDLRNDGIDCITADLLSASDRARLPDAPNIIFMAGQKFGTTGNPATTWAMNATVPALVAETFPGSRCVVFSTGNVYALTPVARGGSSEDDDLAPIGEYANSCLARERIFSAACARHGSPTSILRLNYAHDLRYGVLTDIALRIQRREPVDVSMGFVNVIWQGDANAAALASLPRAKTPEPFVVNVAGSHALRISDLARSLGVRLSADVAFVGSENTDALLSNSTRMRETMPEELLPLDTLLDWVADWVLRGGRVLNKPTGFERRDGRF